MNILLVSAMFPPIRTGSSFYAHDLGVVLAARGHKITVVTLENEDAAAEEIYPFPVHRLPAFHTPVESLFKHLRITSVFPSSYRRTIALAREADVIYLVNHYLDIAFPAVVASLVTGRPLVCSIHTQLQSTSRVKQRVMTAMDRLICGRLIFPFCRRIIALDTEIRRYLTDVHGHRILGKVVIVPYGVGGDFVSHPHSYEPYGQIIGIGAVIEQRNFVASIRLYQRLLDHFPQLRYKIIGHVYHYEAVELARSFGLADRIEFLGERSHADVLEETARSDVYVAIFSGEYVGLGTATIESMRMGLPAVVNAPSDLFGESLLVDMEDYAEAGKDLDGVVRKVTQLLESRELRERIGQGGRRFVGEVLDWSAIAERLERVLAELVAAAVPASS
jgi:glycogen(starch) synthase